MYRHMGSKKTTFNTSFKRLGVEVASDRALERHEIRRTFRLVATHIQIGDQDHAAVQTVRTYTLASIGEIIRAKSKEMVERETRS